MSTKRTLTIVSAPQIPLTEVEPFKQRYLRNKRVVENFDFVVRKVQFGRGDKVLVIAPGIPQTEVRLLRKHLREALKDPNYTVVVNYDCQLDVVPAKFNLADALEAR